MRTCVLYPLFLELSVSSHFDHAEAQKGWRERAKPLVFISSQKNDFSRLSSSFVSHTLSIIITSHYYEKWSVSRDLFKLSVMFDPVFHTVRFLLDWTVTSASSVKVSIDWWRELNACLHSGRDEDGPTAVTYPHTGSGACQLCILPQQ